MRDRLLRLLLPLLAAGGVAGAHALAYVVAEPAAPERHELLASTGHGHTSGLLTVALALGFAAIVAAATLAATGRSGGAALRVTWLRLSAVQLGGFFALEATERALSGSGALGLLAQPVILVGLLAQLGVAAVAVVALRTLTRALRRVLAATSPLRLRRPSQLHWRLAAPGVRRSIAAGRSWTARGPPLVVAFTHL